MNRKIIDFLKLPEGIRIPYFDRFLYRLLVKLDHISIEKEKLPENPLNKEERDK